MKNPITKIFDTCNDPRLLCKAIRRTLHLSQRVMAKRLLTCQCYICWFETGCVYRKLKDGEFNRILYNLKIDFEESVVNISEHTGREQAILTFMQVLIEYLRCSAGRNYEDRFDVLALLNQFSDEFKIMTTAKG